MTEREQLLQEGYDAAQLDAAQEIADTYGLSLKEYATQYLKKVTTKDDVPTKTTRGLKVSDTSKIIAKPGSEHLDISTSVLSLMTCMSATGKGKLHCVVSNEGGESKYTTSGGAPLYLVSKDVYDLMFKLLYTADTKLKEAQKDISLLKTERDLYKATIECLRSNGIIS